MGIDQSAPCAHLEIGHWSGPWEIYKALPSIIPGEWVCKVGGTWHPCERQSEVPGSARLVDAGHYANGRFVLRPTLLGPGARGA